MSSESSIEARIADADLVVLGVVDRVRTFKESGTEWRIVTIRVDEILKGPKGLAPPFLEFVVRAWETGQSAPSRRSLFFVSRGFYRFPADSVFGQFGWVSRSRYGDGLTVDPDIPGSKRALSYTVGFEPLTAADGLLSHARNYCKEEAGQPKPKLIRLEVNGGTVLEVPLDGYTARRARKWARSSDVLLRWRAVEFLEKYKSREDVALLKSMLEDPATVDTGEGQTCARFYSLRAKVWRILTSMGVSGPEPELEEGLVNYQPVHVRASAMTAFALLFLLVAIRRSRRWLFKQWSITTPLVAILAISALWLVSARRFDEWVRDGGSRQRFASFDQHVQYTLSKQWAGKRRFVHGQFPLDDTTRETFDARQSTVLRVLEDMIFHLSNQDECEEFEAFRAPQSCWEHAGIAVLNGKCKDSTGTLRPYIAVRVHYGILLGLAVFPVVVSLAMRVRKSTRLRRRTRLGLCRACGYDLRTSSGRCPECGTICQPVRTAISTSKRLL